MPDMPLPLIAPGETRSFDFAPLPGTFWMHSHVPLQEMQLLAAPLIVRAPEDLTADRQEVVLFLHDFSFKTPEEVLAERRAKQLARERPWTPVDRDRPISAALRAYASMATSASDGAVRRVP